MTETTERNFLPDTNIEIINPDIPRGGFKHVLFDFDGTLSLIREGWQDVMIPMMVDFLRETGTKESDEKLTEIVKEFVTRLTGKQTIYQMIALKDEIEKRGGQAKEPIEYKRIYLDLLWDRIENRVKGLKNGSLNQKDHVVPGAYELVDALKSKNVTMYLASGTDLPYVQDECATLNFSVCFGDFIYGALDDYKNFSKKMIIQKIFSDNNLSGSELLTFGDGYVEIEDTKTAGGFTVGVASDEAGRVDVDEWKRSRLIQAGADLIVPHYRECDQLIDYLFSKD